MNFNHFTSETTEGILDICSDSDFIGIEVVTNSFFKFANLSKAIKSNFSMPLVWGGIHATLCPEECLQYADYVCRGEGEVSIIKLAEKIKYDPGAIKNISNICFKEKKGLIIQNDIGNLEENLDGYPFPDYDYKDHYIIVDNHVTKMKLEHLKNNMFWDPDIQNKFTYHTLSSRGCPFGCAYCCNSALREVYRGKGQYLRFRSIENIINEFETVIAKFKFIKNIRFWDDTFTARSEADIENFAQLYKIKIRLPFEIHVNPHYVSENKIKVLKEAGLNAIYMGIQTGSYKVNKNVYNRNITNEKTLEATKIIDKYSKDTNIPQYDLLFDAFFQKDDDVVETVKLVKSIPGKFWMNHFSLLLFPGSDLYKMFKAKGFEINPDKLYRQNVWQPINLLSNFAWLVYRRAYLFIPESILINEKFRNLINNGITGVIFKLLRTLLDVVYEIARVFIVQSIIKILFKPVVKSQRH